jgi:hypothetical protein
MYPFRTFTLHLGTLIQRVSPRRFWASTLMAGLGLLIVGGIGVSAVLVGRARPVVPSVGQLAHALQVLPQSAPQPDTTAYYLRAQEEQAVRNFWQHTAAPDTTAYYLRAQEEQAIRALRQSAPQPDTTAYYLRAQEEQAVRDFWARAVVPDTTAYYLRTQEEQAVRNFWQRSK